MSGSGNKYGSEKQIQAVTSNLKEDQYLEKTIQTLSLEETYALKLLQLDNRVIKVNYRRLKERVTKIKSHLNADDIVEFKTLEHEKKMKPLYTQVNLSGISKINAAAKRLKLETPPHRRSMSANPKMLRRGVMTPRTLTPQPPRPPDAYDLQRPNSVTGVFIDEPEPETAVRRFSMDGISNGGNEVVPPTTKERKNRLNHTNAQIRSKSADIPREIPVSETPEPESVRKNRKKKRIRPATTLGVPSRSSPNQRKDSLFQKPKYEFSSHKCDPTETPRNKEAELDLSPLNTGRRWSVGSGDSIDAFGPNPHEERRKNLLNNEKETSDGLGTQKDDYLVKVGQFIADGPAVEPAFVETQVAIQDIDSLKVKPKHDYKIDKSKAPVNKAVLEQRLKDLGLPLESPPIPSRRILRKQSSRLLSGTPLDRSLRFDESPQSAEIDPDANLTPFQKQWREVRKTRYLRSRDSQMDLTGVVTLATDQGKIARAWKELTKNNSPFKTGLNDDL